MITKADTILEISQKYPAVRPLFERHGLAGYWTEESLDRIGRFARLGTLLKTAGIDADSFIADLNDLRQDRDTSLADELHFMAMLPCGLRNPFKECFEAHVANHPDAFAGFNFLNEGNVNHELSYYPLLDHMESADELPDVIMASDVNHFFHRPFIDKFLSQRLFESCLPYEPNSYLADCGFYDPAGNYSMYTSNLLVLAVDKKRLGERPMPTCWDDLLDPVFANDIIMRGEGDFFCNAIMLPFFKDHGHDAIKAMARNIKCGKHPAEMVKLAGSGQAEAATLYLLPWFFAQRIKNPQVEIVWPSDGAIASPVFMLAKQGTPEKHPQLFDYLFAKTTSDMLAERHFTPIHPEVACDLPQEVKWLGWDFLTNNDIGAVKDDIRSTFMSVWESK